MHTMLHQSSVTVPGDNTGQQSVRADLDWGTSDTPPAACVVRLQDSECLSFSMCRGERPRPVSGRRSRVANSSRLDVGRSRDYCRLVTTPPALSAIAPAHKSESSTATGKPREPNEITSSGPPGTRRRRTGTSRRSGRPPHRRPEPSSRRPSRRREPQT